MDSKKIQPIGIFDSGYGGLSIFKEIEKLLPEYDYIYLGDNARYPYGTRSFDIIYKYALQAVKHLFDQGCWLIIIACNTASAKALRSIQQNDLPFIHTKKRVLGVLRPTVEVISKYTKTKHVGIFGTEGTVSSKSYPIEINKFFPEVKVVQEACPMWVPLVENNEYDSNGADYFIKKHVNHILEKDSEIDSLLLGCTHYPFLISKIQQFLPSGIRIISQDKIVALSLKDYLSRHPEIETNCTKNSIIKYFTTGDAQIFEKRASVFMGKQLQATSVEY